MKVQSYTNFNNFTSNKNSVLDKIHEKTKNSADLTDTIVVPRTIFKGYLGIMTGTTIVTLSSLINRAKFPKFFKGGMIAGLLTSLYGTWAFVRPFVLKDAVGVDRNKN